MISKRYVQDSICGNNNNATEWFVCGIAGLVKDSQPSRVVVVASMAHNSVKKLDIEVLKIFSALYDSLL